MKDLYEKVSKDAALQQKFSEILAEAEQAGKNATEEELLAFASEAGLTVSLEEMLEFFQGMQAKPEGELSDQELDMVAGGKSRGEVPTSVANCTPVSRNVFCPVINLFGGFPDHLQ